MYHILIIEDDQIQRENLLSMLKTLGTEYRIHMACCSTEALEAASKQHMDLLFIDIGLPDENGLELASKIRKLPGYALVWMVFLTTYTQYALAAFRRVHCYDYLIKPYSKDKVLEYARRLTHGLEVQPQGSKDYLNFEMKGYILKIKLSDILFLEIINKNCTIHTLRQTYLIKRIPLSRMMETLPKEHFLQSHRSYIVNIEKVCCVKNIKGIWEIGFENYAETALMGERYQKTFLDQWKTHPNNRSLVQAGE